MCMTRWTGLLILPLLASCGLTPPRLLEELAVVDSAYVDPDTNAPYTGPVIARFSEAGGGDIRLEARLEDGLWEGEFTMFHPTGRIRYQGSMASGSQCGGWVENENPELPESLLQEVTEELESLVIYPECPDR